MFTWMQIMMGSQGLIQKKFHTIDAEFLQALFRNCILLLPQQQSVGLYDSLTGQSILFVFPSLLVWADKMGLPCFLLRACTQYSFKKGQECLWLSVCGCVSLRCPIPAIISACTIFSYHTLSPPNHRLDVCWVLWVAISAFHWQPSSGNTGIILWTWCVL